MDNIDINSLKNMMNGLGSLSSNNSSKNSSNFGKNVQTNWKNSENKKGYTGKNNFNGNNKANNGRNGAQYGSYNRSNNRSDTYVGAPYNFVPFYKTVVGVTDEQMTTHDKLNDELLTGEIEYTIKAQTPIFIDDGNKRFFTNEKNQIAIPGSSIRGLIRSNTQVLGFASFDEDIDDYNLMYRNVAAGAEKGRYNTVLGADQLAIEPGGKPVSVLKNVSAGYIVKENGKYYIYKTKVDKLNDTLAAMNYYVLSERMICKSVAEGRTDYQFFINHPEKMQYKIDADLSVEDKKNVNKAYIPGYDNVSYSVKNIKNVAGVWEPSEDKENGVLMATGPMQKKKALYIIPKIDRSKEPIEIPDNAVKAFEIDFEKKKNTLKRFKKTDFFDLPKKEGEGKPVFYIEIDGHLYFGFTPRLRLFYDKSLKEGFKQRKNAKFDFSKSLFGCIDEKTGYKSKISFSDAVLKGTMNQGKQVKVILAEPKPTSYLDYILQEQGPKFKTYNSPDFELRGMKQYWLRDKPIEGELNENENVGSTFTPMASGTEFGGKIRFQNLTKEELGLLLWSVRLEDNCQMNIGKGKPYGYGRISLENIKLTVVDNEMAYSLDELSISPCKTGDVDSFINAYISFMNSKQGKDILTIESIKDFFGMKDVTKMPDKESIRYMSINAREYQSRNKALKSVSETINKGK